ARRCRRLGPVAGRGRRCAALGPAFGLVGVARGADRKRAATASQIAARTWRSRPVCGTLRRMLIAQITDLHIRPAGRLAYGRVDTADYLERAVAALLGLGPLPGVGVGGGGFVGGWGPGGCGRLPPPLAPIPRRLF